MGSQIQIQDTERSNCIRVYSEQVECEIIEMSIQVDHVHLLVMAPPKLSISGFVGTIKGITVIRILNNFRKLKEKPYWDNHFWARGYCVDTVGLDSEMVRKYAKYQEAKQRPSERSKY